MQKPKISVIVPCYNQAQYLGECLQSIASQTFTDWECVVVDDGSPDNTEETAAKWTKKDSRFRYLKQQNSGVCAARNNGIENALGEWVLPLDADDKIAEKYLELAKNEFKNGYKLIYCNADFFGGKTGKWEIPEYNYFNQLRGNHIFISAFFRKNDWKNAGGFDTNLIYGFEDWDFWLSLLGLNDKAKKLDYVGFFYRIRQNSRNANINKSAEQLNFTFDYIQKKHIKKYIEINDYYFKLINKNKKTSFFYKLILKFA
jgi:glycosyltransferase involved in cell wall biosynthesis